MNEIKELKEIVKKANNVRFAAEENRELIIDHTRKCNSQRKLMKWKL